MDFEKLNKIECKVYLDEAAATLTELNGYIVNKIIKDENDKWSINPEVKELAKQIYDMDYFLFDKRYGYPVAAGSLLLTYDVEFSENGVEILCGDDDKQRVKKAVIQLLHPVSGFNNDNLKENLSAAANVL